MPRASTQPDKPKRPINEIKRTRLGPIIHHLQTWAAELGKDPETIKKALIKSDYQPKAGEPIPLKAIIAALFGEEHVAKVEGMRLDNQKKAREEAQARGELVTTKEIEETLVSWVVLPLNTALAGMAARVAPLCSNPEAAREAIARDIENHIKPAMREKLPRQ